MVHLGGPEEGVAVGVGAAEEVGPEGGHEEGVAAVDGGAGGEEAEPVGAGEGEGEDLPPSRRGTHPPPYFREAPASASFASMASRAGRSLPKTSRTMSSSRSVWVAM